MRLARRISLAAVLVVNFTALAMGLLSYQQLNKGLADADSNWSAAMAEAVAKAVTKDTLSGNQLAVREVLRRVEASNQSIAYLLVIDFDGEVMSTSYTTQLPKILSQGHTSCVSNHTRQLEINGQGISDVSYPLIEGLDAHLHVGIDQEHVNDTLTEASQSLLVGGMLITLLAVLTALLYSRRLSRPLLQLTSSIKDYGEGRPFLGLGDVSNADLEIRELYQSFQEMVESRQTNVEQLNTLASQLKAVVEVAPIIFLSFDREGMIQVSEGVALSHLGQTPGEAVGQSIYSFYHDYPGMMNDVRRAINGESFVSVIHIEQRILESYWKPLKNAQGEVLHVICVAVDITERQLAEHELRLLNEELEQRVRERTETVREQATLLQQIHDSVVTTDLMGVVKSWNRGAEQLFGYHQAEALGQHISFLFPDEQRATLEHDIIQPLLAKGEFETEVLLQKKNGKHFEGHISLSVLKNEQGEIYGMVAYTLDISDRKQAERHMLIAMQQAEQASRAKSEFLSRMSHELRTPMNAILGFAQLMEQNMDGTLSETHGEYVGEVLKAGYHLLELINEVLDLARIEAGKMQISVEALELGLLMEECVSLIQPLADQRKITIELPSILNDVLVLGDHMRLKQVILNILSNAVKYNREGGEVHLRAEPSEGFYRLAIKDTGPGIPAAMQSRVFEPFDRLNADASNVEGSGIGLSLARRMIEFMGGEIGFESIEGMGSTFWLRIPVAGYEDMSIEFDEKTDKIYRHEGNYRVLYVEDNPSNLRLIERLVEAMGNIKLESAYSAAEAKNKIAKQAFDLILLDIHLGGEEDGYDVFAYLRAEPDTRKIPVVAVSANANPHDIQLGLDVGFDDYLTKPLNVSRFAEVVQRLLSNTR